MHESLMIAICRSCGYCCRDEELTSFESSVFHNELDEGLTEELTYEERCPNCGSDDFLEKYFDEDQEFFEDGAWHDVYECNEDCGDCSRKVYDECTREIKLSFREWKFSRRENVEFAYDKSLEICRLIIKNEASNPHNFSLVSAADSLHKKSFRKEKDKYNKDALLKIYHNSPLVKNVVSVMLKHYENPENEYSFPTIEEVLDALET